LTRSARQGRLSRRPGGRGTRGAGSRRKGPRGALGARKTRQAPSPPPSRGRWVLARVCRRCRGGEVFREARRSADGPCPRLGTLPTSNATRGLSLQAGDHGARRHRIRAQGEVREESHLRAPHSNQLTPLEIGECRLSEESKLEHVSRPSFFDTPVACVALPQIIVGARSPEINGHKGRLERAWT
jgi:hypothetical protein